MILPGATLGVMGGGQLGRMFTAEALRMGYKVVVLDPDRNSPAGMLASRHICAAYDDQAALDDLVKTCDAVTIEFENLPVKSLEYVAAGVSLSPPPACVQIAQDRIREKNFFRDNNLATPSFASVCSPEDIPTAVSETGLPCILKTARFGYDGKGQALCHSEQEIETAFAELGGVECILEQRINLHREVSVVLARGRSGTVTAFPLAENVHVDGILETTTVPSAVDEDTDSQALSLAQKLADRLNYIGVMAVELFISEAGEVLINEMAPRPHNSGHFTQNATASSQFEQQVRMMCDLPPGSVSLLSPVVMLNLLGDLWGEEQPHWQEVFENNTAFLHLYGKHEAREGRKMGHINILGAEPAELLQTARELKRRLAFDG